MYRTQIEFGLAMLAYLMVLVGSVTVVQANPDAGWRYYVAVVPVAPAGFVIWLFVRSLARLDEFHRRIQMQAFGFSLGTTALVTFGYGFLEGAGMPHLSWTYVLPLMAVLSGHGYERVKPPLAEFEDNLLSAAAAALSPPLAGPALLGALERALEARLLVDHGRGYRFRHPLIRAALYEGLSYRRRTQLHTALAAALEQHRPDDVEALAFQWGKSEHTDQGIQYLERAGDRAVAR